MATLVTGNLYDLDTQSADASVGGWKVTDSAKADGTTGPNTTLSRDTAVFHDSPASFKLVATAAGNVAIRTSFAGGPLAAANTTYRHKLHRRATNDRDVKVLINWIDSGGVQISQSNLGTTGTHTADAFIQRQTVDVTSPANTHRFQAVITVVGLAAGEAVYLDLAVMAPPNQAPTANAGPDEAATVGQPLTVTGSGTDPEGGALTFEWSLPTKPLGSAATTSQSGANFTLTPDVEGTYIRRLVTIDPSGIRSNPDESTVTASAPPPPGKPIYLGGTAVSRIYLGSQQVSAIYLGSSLVYSAVGTVLYTVENTVLGVKPWKWSYSGTWKTGTTDHYTDVAGATATHRFTSVRATLYGVREPNGGVMSVTLNGVTHKVDLYADVRSAVVKLWDSGPLQNSEHTLSLACTGDKSVVSAGRFINVDRIVHEVVGGAPIVEAEDVAPPPPGGTTRGSVHLHPYRGSWTSTAADGTWSIWNTPIGSGASLVSASLAAANADGGRITRDPIHIGYPGDPIKTLSSGETRKPWVDGYTAQVRVTPDDTGPGDYSKGNSIAWFPLGSDSTRGWHGHPLALVAGGNPSFRYVDPVNTPDDLFGQGHYGAHGGAHMSGMGGCIRKWEWDSADEAVIQHAIEVNVYAKRFCSTTTNGYRWPANSADSYYASNYGGTNTAVKMGTLLTVPADYNWAAITDLQARKIVRAMWAFGCYIVDDSAWDVHQLSIERTVGSIGSLSLSGFHKPIHDALIASVVVNNNSPTSVGGGGTPRVPLVPDVTR